MYPVEPGKTFAQQKKDANKDKLAEIMDVPTVAIGEGAHTLIVDNKFEQYLQGQKKVAYQMGEQMRAIKNL